MQVSHFISLIIEKLTNKAKMTFLSKFLIYPLVHKSYCLSVVSQLKIAYF